MSQLRYIESDQYSQYFWEGEGSLSILFFVIYRPKNNSVLSMLLFENSLPADTTKLRQIKSSKKLPFPKDLCFITSNKKDLYVYLMEYSVQVIEHMYSQIDFQ